MAGKIFSKARAKFLRDFTGELLDAKKQELVGKETARKEKMVLKKKIEEEKLRQKYVKPIPVQPTQIAKPRLPPQKPIPQFPRPTRPIARPPVQPQPPMQPMNAMPPVAGLNLGKIQNLINDPTITSIECEKPNKKLIITRNGQVMKSEIQLKKDEISMVIKEFSEKARIPLIEGLLRARVGNLQISAVVSNVTSSRFIITRTAQQMMPQQNQAQQMPPRQMPGPPQGMPGMQRSAMPMPPINRPFMPGQPGTPRQPGPKPRMPGPPR